MHTVHDPQADHPCRIIITSSTVNDVEVGREEPIEAGATCVFDKAYCDYDWWSRIHQAGASFVTRAKKNARYEVIRHRRMAEQRGDGFTILADADVRLATQGKTRLACSLRHVRIRRNNGSDLEIITNDRKRSAAEIAALYKVRWQIELLFRRLKQHLKLTRFLGRSENAIRLQILAAMIAFLLLRMAAKLTRSELSAVRFTELAGQNLFVRKPVAELDKPPKVNPGKRQPRHNPAQLEIAYA